jgi:superfamily II DNA/RNA helicase
MVFDEADVLFDKEFLPETRKILEMVDRVRMSVPNTTETSILSTTHVPDTVGFVSYTGSSVPNTISSLSDTGSNNTRNTLRIPSKTDNASNTLISSNIIGTNTINTNTIDTSNTISTNAISTSNTNTGSNTIHSSNSITNIYSNNNKDTRTTSSTLVPIVFVTATFSKRLQTLLDTTNRNVLVSTMPNLHRPPPLLRQEFLYVAANTKLNTLLQIVKKAMLHQTKRIMVFCNTVNSTRTVYHFLQQKQYPVLECHSDMDLSQSTRNLELFDSHEHILVTTDLCSRGVDVHVPLIVLYDFPTTTIDYLHRVGRTARFGASGRVVSLVTKKQEWFVHKVQQL